MSIRRASYVSCDNCGDPAEISTWGHTEARKYAKEQGYTRRKVDGRLADLCSACRDVVQLDGVRTNPGYYAELGQYFDDSGNVIEGGRS